MPKDISLFPKSSTFVDTAVAAETAEKTGVSDYMSDMGGADEKLQILCVVEIRAVQTVVADLVACIGAVCSYAFGHIEALDHLVVHSRPDAIVDPCFTLEIADSADVAAAVMEALKSNI